MKRLQPYIPLLSALTLNLTRLGYDIVRQVIFPGRNRKGNLLSSLFLLFAGLTEQLIGFRQMLLRIPYPFTLTRKLPGQERLYFFWRYGKRWMRQGLLIATWVLFILSSLEWARPDQSPHPTSSQSSGAAIQDRRGQPAGRHCLSIADAPSAGAAYATTLYNPDLTFISIPVTSECYAGSTFLPIAAKRWLRLRILLI